MNTVLVGMPGSGKTTLIDYYERFSGEEVWDTDGVIERLHGNITDIFAEYGEEYFRDLETEAVKQVCALACDALIATGGGCVLREENVRLFKQCGIIVFLRTRFETLLERLKGDESRPLLRGDGRVRLEKLYAERSPLYERVADIIVDTDRLTPREILEEISRRKEELIRKRTEGKNGN